MVTGQDKKGEILLTSQLFSLLIRCPFGGRSRPSCPLLFYRDSLSIEEKFTIQSLLDYIQERLTEKSEV